MTFVITTAGSTDASFDAVRPEEFTLGSSGPSMRLSSSKGDLNAKPDALLHFIPPHGADKNFDEARTHLESSRREHVSFHALEQS